MAGNILKTKTPTPTVRVFNCPKCGSSVTLRAPGQSVAAVCVACSTVIDVTDENYKIIAAASQKGKRGQVLQLGARGKVHGVIWEVIGYMERTDKSSAYQWSEYLLFNPYKGFRWLTESEGHWNYVVVTKSHPSEGTRSSEVSYLNKTYKRFHEGHAVVSYVTGEFYWRVKNGETAAVIDYILPPETLSKEKTGSELSWSLGTYIDAEDIKEGFKLTEAMPPQMGVAPAQPYSKDSSTAGVGSYGILFAIILILLQFANMLFSSGERIYTGNFVYPHEITEPVRVSPQFEIKGRTQNIEIGLQAGVTNSWLEIQGDLVNDETGATFDFEEGVEFYNGYDSDGSWSEGSQRNTVVISSVPPGKYHLNIEASSANQMPVSYDVIVRRDVTTWSNFWWSMLLVTLIPIIAAWRSRSFETERWSQSDYSPYAQHHGD